MENLVGCAKSDLLTPLLLDGLDLPASNDAAKAWCAQVNAAMHSQIVAVPEQRLAQERLLLAPLPSLQLRIGPAPVLRKVDKLSCVRIGSARYSVPMARIGTSVQVVSGSGRVLIVGSCTGEVVADHGAVAPGEAAVADEHYGAGPGRGRVGRSTQNRCEESLLWPWRAGGGVSGRCRRGRAHPPGP